MSDTSRDSLALRVVFEDTNRRDAVARLLAKETRPEFDDDLEAWEAAIFAQVDDIEYPDELVGEGEHVLFVYWLEVDDTVDELDEKLHGCGGEIEKAQLFLGDPFTDDTLDGFYYRRRDGRLILIDPEEHGLAMPDDLPEEGSLPRWARALMQDF